MNLPTPCSVWCNFYRTQAKFKISSRGIKMKGFANRVTYQYPEEKKTKYQINWLKFTCKLAHKYATWKSCSVLFKKTLKQNY